MERVKRVVTQIAGTPDRRLQELPLLHRSLLPLLSLASCLYRLSLLLRRRLHLAGLLPAHRLPVPLISVGNLTWGGNGKTPMVEFLARFLDEAGVPPLILTRGYAGGDEAKMLRRHLLQTSARIGVGSKRSVVAASMFERYGFIDSPTAVFVDKVLSPHKFGPVSKDKKIGVVILDDGMQHWSLLRDVEIVMINGLVPWGNGHLLPRGPMREPLGAVRRADIVVIHHADLVSAAQLEIIESALQKLSSAVPIFFSRLAPSHFFTVKNCCSKLPLTLVLNIVVLCVSAIGFPDAFVQGIQKPSAVNMESGNLVMVCKDFRGLFPVVSIDGTLELMGPLYVDRLDFSDHHFIQANEIEMIRDRHEELKDRFKVKTVVVMTEKDYNRDPFILEELDDLEVLVLCSSLQIMPSRGQAVQDFEKNLKKLLSKKWGK